MIELSKDTQPLTHTGFDPTLFLLVAIAITALLWFAVRYRAIHQHARAIRLYDKLDPIVTAMGTWASKAPATTIYIYCWIATTLLVQGAPKNLVHTFTKYNSTNITEIITEPLRVLTSSAFLVADRGFGLSLYILAFVTIVMAVEHRYGTPRTILIWIVAHFGGSLIMIGLETLALKMSWESTKILTTSDVGVSYVMAGSFGAYLLLVNKRWRKWYIVALIIFNIGLIAPDFGLLAFGHVFATLLGIGTAYACRNTSPLRPTLHWRQLIKNPPRPLPQPQIKPTS